MRTLLTALTALLATFSFTAANASQNDIKSGVIQTNPYLDFATMKNGDAGLPNSQVSTVNPIEDIVRGSLSSLPSLSDISILPTFKTVYPTGEKPLLVISFKCPTELIGITPLPTKLLHEAVNIGMTGINRTDLLKFNLQQVCS